MVAVVGCICLMLFTACGGDKKATPRGAVKVTVQAAAEKADTVAAQYSGTIEAATETPLSFSVPGTVKRVFVKVGDGVKRGQVVAELDATSLQNSYDFALAQLEEAKDAYKRLKMLHDAKALAEIKWVEMQSKLKQAEAAAGIARRALQDAKITAPFSGVVSQKLVDDGQTAAPGVPVITLLTSNELKVKMGVAENQIGNIRLGDRARVSSDALGQGTYGAKVVEKGVQADPLTRSYTVKLLLDDAAKGMLPGMICTVEMLDASKGATPTAESYSDAQITLPVGAVLLSNDNRNFVWLAKGGKAQRRFITVGEMTPAGLTVTKGLERGDSVIVAGQQKVSEGTKIEKRE